MMRKFKRIISSILVTVMISLSMAGAAFAGEIIIIDRICTNIESEARELDALISGMDSEGLQRFLMDNFGATEEEAVFLAQYQNSKVINGARAFPSNPQIGQVYKGAPFTVYVAVGASAATLASIILPRLSTAGAIVSLADALMVAGAVLSLGSAVFGNTVQITPSYTYGYTNDGVLGWTPGYMDIKIL